MKLFFPLQIWSSLHCSQQIPEENIGGRRARLREKENLFRYRAQFEGNLLRVARARARVRALMTQKSCAVGMRNAILRNYLNPARFDKYTFNCVEISVTATEFVLTLNWIKQCLTINISSHINNKHPIWRIFAINNKNKAINLC